MIETFFLMKKNSSDYFFLSLIFHFISIFPIMLLSLRIFVLNILVIHCETNGCAFDDAMVYSNLKENENMLNQLNYEYLFKKNFNVY